MSLYPIKNTSPQPSKSTTAGRVEEPVSRDKVSAMRDRMFAKIEESLKSGSGRALMAFMQTAERTLPESVKRAMEEEGFVGVRLHPTTHRVELLVRRGTELSDALPRDYTKESYLKGAPQVRRI